MPPRPLKALIGVWFSGLTNASAPVRAVRRGHAYWGVGGTADRTIGSADSISARVNRAEAIMFPVAVDQTDETSCGGGQTPAPSLGWAAGGRPQKLSHLLFPLKTQSTNPALGCH